MAIRAPASLRPTLASSHYARPVTGRPTRRKADTLVLCYHAISTNWPAALAVTLVQLREQLEWLFAHGYRGVTFSEALTSRPSYSTVAITFDDAFKSVLEQAAPVMAELGFPGTVFVVTDFADSHRPLSWSGIDRWIGGEHDAELRGMSWPELQRLEQAGWEVASHTLTHPRLTTLGDDALARQLYGSRAACEQALGHPVTSIAYPYGNVDDRVKRATAAAGYTAAGSLPALMGPRDALDWPRIGIYREDSFSRFRFKASPVVRRMRTALAPVDGAARRSLDRGRP
jgi:peptidoglycan/xylan/chitin deacetylase (PgdA/CDA1 family)